MIRKVREYIEQFNMINANDTIVLGVSGGADSVCMFMNLVKYQKIVPFTMKVVHINHLIRKDAAEDVEFVGQLCKDYGVAFYLFEEDVEKIAHDQGISTEEAGRKIRYERFKELADGGKIAVAHNRNDVAETVLFNIFRGTGVEGLASLCPVNDNIIRPLLCLTRQEIEEYLGSINQSYKTDSTNATTLYARNKIRNVVLPYAEKEIVDNATDHIAALSEKMLLVRDFIRTETEKAYERTVVEKDDLAEIQLDNFRELNQMLKNEVILLVLERYTAGRKDIGEVHINAIIKLIDKDGEKRADLPYGLEAVKQYDLLIIRRKTEDKNTFHEAVIDNGFEGKLPDGRKISASVEEWNNTGIERNAYTKMFDCDKIVSCVKVRYRQPGDYLIINAKGDKKSLSDYMIDNKIPREKRDVMPVIADGSHILWIPDYRISEYYKVTEDTKQILKISID